MGNNIWDVVVIGGGPSGLSAALTLGRARRRTIVIDAGQPRNRFAAHMHGVLGNEGREPADLIRAGREEATTYGVAFEDGVVRQIDDVGSGIVVSLDDGSVHSSRSVIVSSGLADELPDIPGLAERWGSTVLHCPYCHGWEFRDQRLAVLATSSMSLHQVELVRQWSERVTMFTSPLAPLEPDIEKRLRARGIELIADPVAAVVEDDSGRAGVRLDNGDIVATDALFVAPTGRVNDGFLSTVALERSSGPMGEFLAVDQTGKTSNERIWAVGNVVSPPANVPMVMATGAVAAAAVNMALTNAEFDAAVAGSSVHESAVGQFWEERYAGSAPIWSGHANKALVEVVSKLPVGRALDLGCGEGGDACWLATQGWNVIGIDVSATAISRARDAATQAGIPADHLRFETGDLTVGGGRVAGGAGRGDPDEEFDLVTACFFHSPIEIPRTDILRRAAGRVRAGGHFLIVSHADFPHWSNVDEHEHEHEHLDYRFLSADEEIAALALESVEWDIQIAETRSRQAVGPDGEQATLEDVVVLLRRR